MEDRIKQTMSAVFGVGVDEIGNDASPSTVAAWDSLKHMQLILALEEEFGIEFSDEQIVELMSFPVIRDTVKGML